MTLRSARLCSGPQTPQMPRANDLTGVGVVAPHQRRCPPIWTNQTLLTVGKPDTDETC
jgi:hypothetical protein